MSQEQIDELGKLIDRSEKILCFTGAGISTESGIPDFRSPGTGLWTKIQPIQFQDFMASADIRKESWRRKFAPSDGAWENAEPNVGHKALARLVELGKCIGIITQNVDNLQRSMRIYNKWAISLKNSANNLARVYRSHNESLRSTPWAFISISGVRKVEPE